MRIGMIANSGDVISMQNFAQEKGFTYTPVYYSCSAELEQAFIDNTEIDAAVTSNMRKLPNAYELDLFDTRLIYAMVTKDNTELLSEINYAVDQIAVYEPTLFDELYQKYYALTSDENIAFTPGERAFIAECCESGVVFNAVMNPDRYPYSYFEDASAEGIIARITELIKEKTGLNINVIKTKTREEYKQLISEGNVICLDMQYDYSYAESLGYDLTSPYMDVKLMTLFKDISLYDYLIKAYESGTGSTSYEGRMIGDDGKYHSCTALSFIYADDYDNVCCFILIKKKDNEG